MPLWLMITLGYLWLRKEEESGRADAHMPTSLRAHVLEALGRSLRAETFDRLAAAFAKSGYPAAGRLFAIRADEQRGAGGPRPVASQYRRDVNDSAVRARIDAESDPTVLEALSDVLELAGMKAAAATARAKARSSGTPRPPEQPLRDLLDSLEPYDDADEDDYDDGDPEGVDVRAKTATDEPSESAEKVEVGDRNSKAEEKTEVSDRNSKAEEKTEVSVGDARAAVEAEVMARISEAERDAEGAEEADTSYADPEVEGDMGYGDSEAEGEADMSYAADADEDVVNVTDSDVEITGDVGDLDDWRPGHDG